MIKSPPSLFRYWSYVFGLFSIQSLFAIIAIVSSSSDPEKRVFLGLSTPRIVLFLTVLGFACFTGFISIFSARHHVWREEWLNPARHPRLWNIILLLNLASIGISQMVLLVLRGLSVNGEVFVYTAYANRLAPILNLFSLCGMELFLWLIFLRTPDFSKYRSLLRTTIFVWFLLGMTATFILITKIGLTVDGVGSFGLPAVPLLEWQLFIAWLTGLIIILLEKRNQKPKIRHPDIWIMLLIWAITSALWLSQPVNPAYFATPPRLPNLEIYPFSDALNYAVEAQSILIGNGMTAFFDGIPPRPFYIEVLAWLHALAGQNYSDVIALQTLILAFFPALLYLVGKEIAGRWLGIPIALLAALRDVTSNQAAPFTDNITYSKLFFSELPVALLLILFILLVIRWMKDPSKAGIKPATAGGILGLAMLIRTQSIILLFVTFLLAILIFRNKWKIWFGQFILLTLVLIFTISPWLWRNAQVTGGIIFDHPATQTMILAQRYNDGQTISQMEDETLNQYSNRLMQATLKVMKNRPVETSRVILGHFFNNLIDNILLFPLRNNLQNISELVVPSRAFWQELPNKLNPKQITLIGIYLLILGLGIAAAWQRMRWIGMFPLIANLAYNLWTSIFRSSGGRFLVPIDWVFYLYGVLGLLIITNVFFLFFANTKNQSNLNNISVEKAIIFSHSHHRHNFTIRSILVGIFFFALGSSLPLSERIVPKLYPIETPTASHLKLLDEQILTNSGIELSIAQSLIENENMLIIRGRAVYPRYYASGEGEPKTAKIGYSPSSQPRLLFYLIGDVNRLVILEASSPPEFFPHLADVVVLGVDHGTYIEAHLIRVDNQTASAAYLSH